MARLAKQAGVPRFLFASSCSNYGARRPVPGSRHAAFNPVTPYGESKVEGRAVVAPLADDDVQPDVPARVDGLRPVAAPPLRPGAQQPDRLGLHHRRGLPEERRHALAADRARRGHRARLHRRARGAARAVHTQAFNVGSTTENYRIREIAEIVRRWCPAAESTSPRTRRPTSAATAWTATRSPATLHEFKPQWTARRGVEQLYEAYQRVGLKLEDFEGERFKRIDHIKKLVGNGDAWLRSLRRRSKPRMPENS